MANERESIIDYIATVLGNVDSDVITIDPITDWHIVNGVVNFHSANKVGVIRITMQDL